MSNNVCVLDTNRKPLMPCRPSRARQLLNNGKAAVFKYFPFTIILNREGGDVQPVQYKIDPGSNITGITLVSNNKTNNKAVIGIDLEHRGELVKYKLDKRNKLRRNRRSRKTRYRPVRYNNRKNKKKGWLPPSLMSRINNVTNWLRKLLKLVPITSISLELTKFDTQKLHNPEISGVMYQQGTLLGYEVKEYLLEKNEHKCVYCGERNVPLQIEHIIPKSRGGTNRIDNLTIACGSCNQNKGNKTAAEFGFPEVQEQVKKTLRDAAVMNATRWRLYKELQAFGLPIEVGTGGRTKFNRSNQNYPKKHWIDAACVGESGANVIIDPEQTILSVKAMGRGNRQMCATDKYGFPNKHRSRKIISHGFQTGDMVKAVVPTGKNVGTYIGRVTIRSKPSFTVKGVYVHPKRLTLLQKTDGYSYS